VLEAVTGRTGPCAGALQLAEAFEQYLFENKAPSLELRNTFAKFATWLKQVYKSIKSFMAGRNLRVSDDIRQVFDRMLATEEQIAEAEHVARFEAVYRSADEGHDILL